MRHFLRRVSGSAVTLIQGFCMGAADVVPGVSGGTMAFVLRIYPRLMTALSRFDRALLGLLLRGRIGAAMGHVDSGFLLALAIGLFSAILFFTRVVPLPQLIRTDPEAVYGLFFGLVAGSVVLLFKELGRVGVRGFLWVALGIIAGYTVVTLVPMQTPETPLFVFLTGMVAISAMLVPGVSGSFVLLVLRKYSYIFEAVGEFRFAVLLPFAAGCGVGIMLFSRLISWCLRHYYRPTLLLVNGVLIGSLWLIWPFQQRNYAWLAGKSRLVSSQPFLPTQLDQTLLLSVALAAVGFVLVMGLNRLAAGTKTH
ncbi:MAG: DUF368 domain-containing protein [Gammaproteobacteria bacterium]|nr:DUF368 domain-containing protein [Gammaproteobacteria bacterium]